MSATLTIKFRTWYMTEQEWTTPGSVPKNECQIAPGVTVEYVSHLPGGMVKVRHNGQLVVIHPGGTVELS